MLFGSGYTVNEDVIPANWAFDHLDCSASTGVTPSINGTTVTFGIDADTDVLDCTYYNELQQGALRILKNSTKGGAVANAGAVFSYDGASVTDNGAGDEDSTSARCASPVWRPATTTSTRPHRRRATATPQLTRRP